MWAAIVNIVLGVALMVAPAYLGFNKETSDHFYIIAPIIVTFSIIAISDINRVVRFANVPLGAYLAVCPFIYGFEDSTATWVAVIGGLLVVFFSFFKGKLTDKVGGGWASMFQKNPEHMQHLKEEQGL